MHQWEKAYKQGKFAVTTRKPSVIVKINGKLFSSGDKVLDIGCGNGRNAIFLAEKGCDVNAIDIADIDWVNCLSNSIKKYIHFKKINLNDFKWNKKYDGIILTRVIQYLSSDELIDLVKNIHANLTDRGIFLLNFTSKGGIRNRSEINVPKFSHDIKEVKKLLEKYFADLQISHGATHSIHVGYDEPIESHDIKCSGLRKVRGDD